MDILELIGKAPLIKLDRINNELDNNIYVKCDFLNPGGSIKDLIALYMVKDALKKGNVKAIVEPTSGNTGIGLALVCAKLGIDLTIVMPESMSIERRSTIKHFGAKLVLTPANEGMQGSIDKALELAQQGAVILNQFENPANIKAHYEVTAPIVYESVPNIDIFITGVGTGGTISGVGKFLKERKGNIKVVAIEPSESAVISGKQKGIHKIEGIGAGFIPKNLDLDILDDVVEVTSKSAIENAKELAKKEALFVGISSGANLAGIKEYIKRYNLKDKNIVTVMPDSASRYLSTELFK